MMLVPGGILCDVPARASLTSNSRSVETSSAFGTKRSMCRLPGGQCAAAFSVAFNNAAGPQQ